MLFILLLVLSSILFWISAHYHLHPDECYSNGYRYDWDDRPLFPGLGFLTILVLVGALIAMPITVYNQNQEIDAFIALQETVDVQRESEISDYERITLTNKIIEANQDLAKAKYAKTHLWFNWFNSKRVLELEFIK